MVGGREHGELWVPAGQLVEFNLHIVGLIAVVNAYFGPRFRGFVPERGYLERLDAAAQLVLLAHLLHARERIRSRSFEANHTAIFLHCRFWERHDLSGEIAEDDRGCVLEEILNACSGVFPEIPLTMLWR